MAEKLPFNYVAIKIFLLLTFFLQKVVERVARLVVKWLTLVKRLFTYENDIENDKDLCLLYASIQNFTWHPCFDVRDSRK